MPHFIGRVMGNKHPDGRLNILPEYIFSEGDIGKYQFMGRELARLDELSNKLQIELHNELVLLNYCFESNLGPNIYSVNSDFKRALFAPRSRGIFYPHNDYLKKYTKLFGDNINIGGTYTFGLVTELKPTALNQYPIEIIVDSMNAFNKLRNEWNSKLQKLNAREPDPKIYDRIVSKIAKQQKRNKTEVLEDIVKQNTTIVLPDGDIVKFFPKYFKDRSPKKLGEKDSSEPTPTYIPEISPDAPTEKYTGHINNTDNSYAMPRIYGGTYGDIISFREYDKGLFEEGDKVEVFGTKMPDNSILLNKPEHYVKKKS